MTEALIEHLKPIRYRFFETIKDKGYIEKCYKGSAEEALKILSKTLNDVKKKIGFILWNKMRSLFLKKTEIFCCDTNLTYSHFLKYSSSSLGYLPKFK